MTGQEKDPGLDAIISPFETTDIPWPGGRRLYEWWDAAKGSRRYPSRSDFSPGIMRPFLRTMVLHDIGAPEAPDFRLRLVGTEIVEVLNSDPTGQPLAAIPNTEPLAQRYNWVLETGRPYLCLNLPLAWASKTYRRYSTLVLPLGTTGDRVDMLIANVHFQPTRTA